MTKKGIALLFGPAILIVVGLIVYSTYESRRREALDRKLFPYDFQPVPKARYKTNKEAAESTPEGRCRVLRERVRDKRLSDLTVRESEILQVCRALGL